MDVSDHEHCLVASSRPDHWASHREDLTAKHQMLAMQYEQLVGAGRLQCLYGIKVATGIEST